MGVFYRLNYNYDSTKFGDGQALSPGQERVLSTVPPALKEWQADDLINASVNGYFQNPLLANVNTLLALINSLNITSNSSNITYTYASDVANGLYLSTSNVASEIPLFIDHTNRISGVTSTTNPLTTPDYQFAISVGRQVLTIVEQVDGSQNNIPMLGNFTSLTISDEISNTIITLTNDNETFNSTIEIVDSNAVSNISSSAMSGIIDHVNYAYNLLNARRTADVSFYVNSLSLIRDYNTVTQFNNLGVNSKYLIYTLNIGTDKLKTNLLSTPYIQEPDK
jgi:hypothetical protein